MSRTKIIAVVGDSGVGKTSYIKRLVYQEQTEKHIPTIGVESYTLKLAPKSRVILRDTAGDPRLGGDREYFLYTDAAIVIGDGDKWLQRLRDAGYQAPVLQLSSADAATAHLAPVLDLLSQMS